VYNEVWLCSGLPGGADGANGGSENAMTRATPPAQRTETRRGGPGGIRRMRAIYYTYSVNTVLHHTMYTTIVICTL
jgi:hypothetical protein